MTNADISRIEAELGISLPDAYKSSVSPYPIRAMTGNGDSDFWDDATKLIELNMSVRQGRFGLEPWPTWLFAVGEMDEESFIAIDLRDSQAPTWWVDHGGIKNKGTRQTHARFVDWVTKYVSDIRSDMEGDGYNPDVSPEVHERALKTEYKRELRTCVISLVIFVIVALVVGTWLMRKWVG